MDMPSNDDDPTPTINVNINVEELHLHYPSVETDAPIDIGVDEFAGAAGADASTDDDPERTGGGGGTTGPRPGGHDIRDKPTSAVVLQEAAESDGVAPAAIAEMYDLKSNTVSGSMRALYERGALDIVDRGTRDMPFYVTTDFGERVLADYRQRWNEGYWKLPKNYWDGVPTREAENTT